MLVSNKDAGTVIGRGGQTISGMQNKSGSRIRVSNNNEYFPGTMDRVVMISGPTAEVVASGCTLVLAELFCNSESAQQASGADQPITVNLLIPNTAAGLVIGKAGENIRRMVEESGASKIQLAPKERQIPGIDERQISVIGNVGQVQKASELVVAKICEDPQVKFFNLTTQYKGVGAIPPQQGGGGNFGGRGAPGGYGAPPYGGGYEPYGAPPPGGHMPQGGYRAPDPYGAPAPYPGYGQAPSMYPDYSQQQQHYGAAPQYPPQHGGGYGAPAPHAHHGGYEAAPPMGAYGGPPASGHSGPSGCSHTIQVADHAVPAILGRAGAVIKEMMEQSGATIKVSQKGEYAPGTSNRVVTITASTPAAASMAYQLVSAKIPAS